MTEPRAESSAGRTAAVMAALVVLLAVVAALRLGVGTSMGWPSGEHAGLILEERGHRLVIGLVVGAALAVSGVALQSLLRNPLAEPFILGLSTGAGAGIMAQWALVYFLAQSAGEAAASLGPSYLGALAGAAASMGVVYLASRRGGVIDPIGLLLTGVVLSTINGALIMAFNFLAGPGGLREDLARWMMGFLNASHDGRTVAGVGAVVGAGIAVLLWHERAMDVATVSDDEARGLGVQLDRLRVVLFATASVLAAAGVVLAGPIAFVGLICPHIGRLLLGPSHGPLLIVSAVLGAALVVAADTASAALALTLGIGTLPIGIFTAMLGGPAFLWMLRPQLGRGM